jgi:hypothetical protein
MSDGGLQQVEGGHLVLHPELQAEAPTERIPGFAFRSTRVHRAAQGDRQLIKMPAIIAAIGDRSAAPLQQSCARHCSGVPDNRCQVEAGQLMQRARDGKLPGWQASGA